MGDDDECFILPLPPLGWGTWHDILNAYAPAPPPKPDPCPGEGRCHGCVVWCAWCGDVENVCDCLKCGIHSRDIDWSWDPEAGAKYQLGFWDDDEDNYP